MPHDDPFFKAAPQRQKAVTAQQILHGVLAQGLIRVYRRVGKDEALRLYRVRKRREKAPLRLKRAGDLALAGGEAARLEQVKPRGVEHIPEYAALFVQYVVHEVLVHKLVIFEYRAPVVAVAAHGVHIAAARERHYISQRAEAVRALFEKVPVDDELIVRAKARLFQHALEVFKIAVYIRHDDDAPPLRDA